MKAIILAHDQATTLEPFTTTRPRVMIPVLNVPLIEQVIRQVADSGIKDIFITTGYLREKIENYLREKEFSSLNIKFILESEIPDFLSFLDDSLLLVDGGVYMEDDFIKHFINISSNASIPSMALATSMNPLYHLQADLAKNNIVKKLQVVSIEQIKIKQQSPLECISSNCMFIPKSCLLFLIDVVQSSVSIKLDNILNDLLKKNTHCQGNILNKRFVTVDYPWEILAASYLGLDLEFGNKKTVRKISSYARVHPDAIMKGTVIIGDNTIVESNAVLENVRIGTDCHIKENSYIADSVIDCNCIIGPMGYVRMSVLGPNTRIGTPSEFPRAVIFGNGGCAHHCHAGMGVYGEKISLMAGAIVTANRGNPIKVKIDGNLIDTGWFNVGAFVGDNTRINANATIMPGRKLGPNSIIGPGVIVYRDVEPNTMIVLKQQYKKIQL